MSSSTFATFAPYTPPPDDPSHARPASTSRFAGRPWFPAASYENSSYQDGGIPTFNTSMTGNSSAPEDESPSNQWETACGMRVDALAASAYILGPISALLILILETQNDYVRFHAYQSALLSAPLFFIRFFASVLQFTPWIRTFLTLCLFTSFFHMSFRAYRGATQGNLAYYRIPWIGPLAERWLSEE